MARRIPILLLSTVVGVGAQVSKAVDKNYIGEVERFRAKHEADYRREYVPLAGLSFLKSGFNTAGSEPSSDVRLPARAPRTIGRFAYRNQQVTFEPQPGASMTLNGKPLRSAVELRSDEPGP